jgi:hypothetical protein
MRVLLALLLSLGGIPGAAAVVSLEVPSAPWELAPGETRELELVVKIQHCSPPGWKSRPPRDWRWENPGSRTRR